MIGRKTALPPTISLGALSFLLTLLTSLLPCPSPPRSREHHVFNFSGPAAAVKSFQGDSSSFTAVSFLSFSLSLSLSLSPILVVSCSASRQSTSAVCFPRVSVDISVFRLHHHISSCFRCSSLLVDITSESSSSVGILRLPFLASPVSFSLSSCANISFRRLSSFRCLSSFAQPPLGIATQPVARHIPLLCLSKACLVVEFAQDKRPPRPEDQARLLVSTGPTGYNFPEIFEVIQEKVLSSVALPHVLVRASWITLV